MLSSYTRFGIESVDLFNALVKTAVIVLFPVCFLNPPSSEKQFDKKEQKMFSCRFYQFLALEKVIP